MPADCLAVLLPLPCLKHLDRCWLPLWIPPMTDKEIPYRAEAASSRAEPVARDKVHQPPHALPDLAVPVLTRPALNALCDAGAMSSAAWQGAIDYCGFTPTGKDWLAYWRQLCLLGGALFFVAGVICFIAWNWGAMTPLARMALTGAVVAVSGLGAVLLGPDTRLGRVLLLVCGIGMGPMLAVFGQTYQTGAELWELFRVWTVLLVLLALAGRQTGLWFAAWIVANIFVALWLGRGLASPTNALGQFFTVTEWLVVTACALVCWEWAAHRAAARSERNAELKAGRTAAQDDAQDDAQDATQDDAQAWICSRWMPRLLYLDLVSRTALFLISMICGMGYGKEYYHLWMPHNAVVGIAVGVAGFSWWWYRTRQPDLFMLTALLAAASAVLLAALAEAELFFSAGTAAALVLWGLLVTGLTAGLAKVLVHLQRGMHAAPERAKQNAAYAPSALGRQVAPVSWQALWEHLQICGLVPQSQALPQVLVRTGEPHSPWYVRAMLAFGGWLAAVFFVCFFGFMLFVVLEIRSDEELAVFIASVPVVLVGRAALARKHMFARHFGFAMAVAGTVGISLALCASLYSEALACFALAALLLALIYFMRTAAYTFVAATVFGNSVAAGILLLTAEHAGRGLAAPATGALAGASALLIGLWWALVCLALVFYCLQEEKWRGVVPVFGGFWGAEIGQGTRAEPLFYGLYAALLLFEIVSLGTRHGLAASVGVPVVGSGYAGLAAAVGVAVLAFCLVRRGGRIADGGAQPGTHRSQERSGQAGSVAVLWVLLAGLPLVLALGWYLPGAVITLLGLLLARQMGNAVMQGFALAYLGAYMVFYYYSLAVSLEQKSLYLAATGLGLLTVAFMLRLWQAKLRAGVGADHA
ncbi:DUF4401 domain-containing protein [Desulfovibrio sp.]|uniref:DUF4401 domain-containing protein n=1 Tax=Desulfovibrio sp. TaxID=885 RepID=UPI0035B203C0